MIGFVPGKCAVLVTPVTDYGGKGGGNPVKRWENQLCRRETVRS